MTEPQLWVLDTNLLVSRLLAPGGTTARAVDQALASGVLLVSEATLEELANVLARPRFDPYVALADRQRFVAMLGGVARLIHVTRRFQSCRDPKDDKFLGVAVAGDARAIVTGDRDLLELHPFHGIEIVTPARFLAV